MKKGLQIILLFLCSITATQAQDSLLMKRREIWIGVGNIVPLSFDITYKYRVGKRTYLRGTIEDMSFDLSRQQNMSPAISNGRGYSAGLVAGLEFRHRLAPRLYFFHGPGLTGFYRYRQNFFDDGFGGFSDQRLYTSTVGIDYTTGVLLLIRENVVLGLQIDPALQYSKTRQVTRGSLQDVEHFNDNTFGSLSRHAPKMSVAYRF
jgi:hypothetical protein